MADRSASEYREREIAGRPLRCPVCDHPRFRERNLQVTQLGRPFAARGVKAPALVCERCRHVVWFYPE
jgi:hypothetical protein